MSTTVEIAGMLCEVTSIMDGYARGPNGRCAFCNGDPCNERPITGSRIAKFYAENPRASSCPCCDGRPT